MVAQAGKASFAGDHGRVELLGGWQSDGDERLLGGRVLDGQGVALAGDLLTADEQPGLHELSARRGGCEMRAARGLLAGGVVAVQRARLRGLVDPRDEVAELVVGLRGVALADRRFQAVEPGLHLGSAAPILEALALRPMNPLFL